LTATATWRCDDTALTIRSSWSTCHRVGLDRLLARWEPRQSSSTKSTSPSTSRSTSTRLRGSEWLEIEALVLRSSRAHAWTARRWCPPAPALVRSDAIGSRERVRKRKRQRLAGACTEAEAARGGWVADCGQPQRRARRSSGPSGALKARHSPAQAGGCRRPGCARGPFMMSPAGARQPAGYGGLSARPTRRRSR